MERDEALPIDIRRHLEYADIFDSTGKSEVWNNLQDALGRPINDDSETSIMRQFIENDVRIAFFIGAPAHGKTTTMNQFGTELVRRTGGIKTPVYYTFEESLSDPEVVALGDRALYTQKEWGEHSRIFAKRIEEKMAQLGPNQVLLVESPSVGDVSDGKAKSYGTNRGVEALITITKAHPTDSMVIAVIGEPEIERLALKIRKDLTESSETGFNIPDQEVISYLRRQNKIVGGLDHMSIEEAGALVRRAVATMDRWDEKKTENVEQFDDLVDSDSLPEGKNRLPEVLEMQIIAKKMGLDKKLVAPIPPDPNRSIEDERKLIYLSRYIHLFLGPRLGVGKDRFYAVFNRYLPDQLIHYLRGEYLLHRADLN